MFSCNFRLYLNSIRTSCDALKMLLSTRKTAKKWEITYKPPNKHINSKIPHIDTYIFIYSNTTFDLKLHRLTKFVIRNKMGVVRVWNGFDLMMK